MNDDQSSLCLISAFNSFGGQTGDVVLKSHHRTAPLANIVLAERCPQQDLLNSRTAKRVCLPEAGFRLSETIHLEQALALKTPAQGNSPVDREDDVSPSQRLPEFTSP